MFGRSNGSKTTLIGRGARFVGTLELEGAAYIEGRCEGTIRAQGQISVGPHGSVVGELVGNVVIIAGHVEGTVVAQQTLHVLRNGSVKGDASYGRLQVDCGGVIDGQSHQGPPAAGDVGLERAPSVEAAPIEQTGVMNTRVRSLSVRPAPPSAEIRPSSAAGRR